MTHDHPRPQLQRTQWLDLGGMWRFAHDDTSRWEHPAQVTFDRQIQVPFAPESQASGIGDTTHHPVVWYALELTLEPSQRPHNQCLLLHFGAVDYAAKVWVNGQLVAEHQGGHTPFSADLTHIAGHSPQLEIVVRAEDDSQNMQRPRGKQDWQSQPHAIWYPRTTGIWQTVWLEWVPLTRLAALHWTSSVERWEIGLEAHLAGPLHPDLALRVQLFANGRELCNEVSLFKSASLQRRIALPDPGIDDERNNLLWSPEHPHLIEARLELLQGQTVLDQVSSYTALRSVAVEGSHFLLNGHPYRLRMVLDQGYWPDSLMTAPNPEALRRDVELTKMLGFNGARKHQKIEDPRWLYWCDVLGLLVWEEMPSHYAFSNKAVRQLVGEWLEVLERDRSHPCIMAWVPFNESWGVPNLNSSTTQRHYVEAIYHLTKTLDPHRLAIGNDGWEFVAGDWLGIHDYTAKPEKLLGRYGTPAAVRETLEHPYGRLLLVPGVQPKTLPVVLSEFGGVAFSPQTEVGVKTSWGYSRAADQEAFLTSYAGLLAAAHQLEGTVGFCYTQLTDTFQEKNGLLDERRRPKADLFRLSAATRGERNLHEAELEGEQNPLGYAQRWYKPRQLNGSSQESKVSADD